MGNVSGAITFNEPICIDAINEIETYSRKFNCHIVREEPTHLIAVGPSKELLKGLFTFCSRLASEYGISSQFYLNPGNTKGMSRDAELYTYTVH